MTLLLEPDIYVQVGRCGDRGSKSNRIHCDEEDGVGETAVATAQGYTPCSGYKPL